MDFMTTGSEMRKNKKVILSKDNAILGKIEILLDKYCYHLFVDGTPINYWYEKEIAFSEFNRLVAVKSL